MERLPTFALLTFIAIGSAFGASNPKGVYFIQPQDGWRVPTKFKVQFGLREERIAEGWKVEPSGPPKVKSGHHHVLVARGPMKKGTVVPKGKKSIHYGKGQTEAMLNLAPGKYRLTMQFADGNHVSYGPEWSHSINITVEKRAKLNE